MNKQGAKALPYSRIPTYKCKRDDENGKLAFEKHHSNNDCMQESSTDDKIGE